MTAILGTAAEILALASAVLWVTRIFRPRVPETAAAGTGLAASSCWLAASILMGDVPLVAAEAVFTGFCAWTLHQAVLDAHKRRARETARQGTGGTR
jgi:hypothetical protein